MGSCEIHMDIKFRSIEDDETLEIAKQTLEFLMQIKDNPLIKEIIDTDIYDKYINALTKLISDYETNRTPTN